MLIPFIGFIETADGRKFYFSRSYVMKRRFGHLNLVTA